MMAETEKIGDEVSTVDNDASSNSTSEKILQEADSDEAETDYPHGVRLVFVVIALVLSMFLVCLKPCYYSNQGNFLMYILGCPGYGMPTMCAMIPRENST